MALVATDFTPLMTGQSIWYAPGSIPLSRSTEYTRRASPRFGFRASPVAQLALEAAGLTVNRLIRTRYGPFALDRLQRGEVTEVPGFELRKAVRGIFEITRDGERG